MLVKRVSSNLSGVRNKNLFEGILDWGDELINFLKSFTKKKLFLIWKYKLCNLLIYIISYIKICFVSPLYI